MTEDFFFVRPATGQKLRVGERRLPDPRPKIYPQPPRVGLVISTYGGVPFIDLALAVRHKFYPDLPVLVHDDASPNAAELQSLCLRHGVEFECNSSRLGHQMGDLSGLVGGLRWAQERGIDLLVKMSQRFIPLVNWVSGLVDLAMESQYPTFSNKCAHYQFPIRSECIGLFVPDWMSEDVCGEMAPFMLANLTPLLLELYVHEYSFRVSTRLCDAARMWEQRTPRMRHKPGFAIWDFVGNNRHEASRSFLWHNANPLEHYADAAGKLGLRYQPQAFVPSS